MGAGRRPRRSARRVDEAKRYLAIIFARGSAESAKNEK
jgi:hypothetical protein